MRADHVADPADARRSRPHDERPATVAERHLQSGRPAPRADRAIGAEQLRRAIHRRSQFARRAARLFRRAVRRRHDRKSERRRRAERDLSHRLRAQLRRLLFPDLLFDAAVALRRGPAHLPARMPGGRCRAVFLPQSWREHGSGGVDQRATLHRAADRISLSHAAYFRLFVPQAGRELGRRAQECRRFLDARERRHRRDRPERESAVAAAEAGRQTAGRSRGGQAGRQCGAGGRERGPCRRYETRRTRRRAALPVIVANAVRTDAAL